MMRSVIHRYRQDSRRGRDIPPPELPVVTWVAYLIYALILVGLLAIDLENLIWF